MDLNRLGTGTTIAASAAIVLLGSMFLGWFQLENLSGTGVLDDLGELVQAVPPDATADAWQSFGAIDVALALAVAAALGLALLRAWDDAPETPAWLSTVVGALGLVGAVLILYRIISPPDLVGAFGGGGSTAAIEVETEVGREPWLFVGFAAAAAIAYGGWRQMQEDAG